MGSHVWRRHIENSAMSTMREHYLFLVHVWDGDPDHAYCGRMVSSYFDEKSGFPRLICCGWACEQDGTAMDQLSEAEFRVISLHRNLVPKVTESINQVKDHYEKLIRKLELECLEDIRAIQKQCQCVNFTESCDYREMECVDCGHRISHYAYAMQHHAN